MPKLGGGRHEAASSQGPRYQVSRVTAVQSLTGVQHALPAGFAEIEPLQLGFRIVMRMEQVRLILSDQEFDRLCDEGKMRKL